MAKMIALVTGVSSGFGRVIAHALAGAGPVDYASMREWCVLMFGSYRMSEVGQTRTSDRASARSAHPPIAEVRRPQREVRLVPQPDSSARQVRTYRDLFLITELLDSEAESDDVGFLKRVGSDVLSDRAGFPVC
jgi:hypothetical protein